MFDEKSNKITESMFRQIPSRNEFLIPINGIKINPALKDPKTFPKVLIEKTFPTLKVLQVSNAFL